MPDGPIAVLGLGNVLLHDDAFGPQVIRELKAGWEFPAGVFVDDLGTPGLELSSHLAGYRFVVLVDAVAAERAAGTIVTYEKQAILHHPTGIRLGPHDPSLADVLLTMELVDDGPGDVLLVGAVPRDTQPGIGMCDEMRAAAPVAAAMIAAEIGRRGFSVLKRPARELPVAWWESEVSEPAYLAAGNQGQAG